MGPSQQMIEELMLITSSMLPYHKDELISKADILYRDMLDFEKERNKQL